jgi:predicted nucleic acid-binding protein
MIILDTNVVSEPSKPRPSASVLKWLAAQNPEEIFTTTATEAEIFYGFALLATGKKRTDLERAARAFFEREVGGRVLAFDRAAAQEFGVIAAARKKAGRPIKVFDTQIAAIALAQGAVVATRDVADFEFSGVTIVNPWTAYP